jgi:uroporphyrinogen-III decarboxylase
LLNASVSYKNFVLPSGCDIHSGTRLLNIDAFFETLSFYIRQRNKKVSWS